MAARKRATARGAVRPGRPRSRTFGAKVPSGRSLALGLGTLLVVAGGYLAARETSVFAIRDLELVGGSPRLQASVREALEPQLGRSLVSVGHREIRARVKPLAGVVSVRTDRAFPHTLRVYITPERPVLLLRRGSEGWVVSARGRVLRKVRTVKVSSLPRTWGAKDTAIQVGATLPPAAPAGAAAAALAPLAAARFPARVRSVRARDRELTLVLRSGLEVRFGDRRDLRLKLAVARRILLQMAPEAGETYVDVSVPDRPVTGTASLDSKVEIEG